MYAQCLMETLVTPLTSSFISLTKMAESTHGYSTSLGVIDFLEIPHESGDSVVLIVMHPGPNLLGRYLPPAKVNDLLLAKISHVSLTLLQDDVSMKSADESEAAEVSVVASDTMDIASFLEWDMF